MGNPTRPDPNGMGLGCQNLDEGRVWVKKIDPIINRGGFGFRSTQPEPDPNYVLLYKEASRVLTFRSPLSAI